VADYIILADEKTMTDTKTEPKHYTDFPITPIDAIEVWGVGFSIGNAIKYMARAGKKDGETTLDDLRKARWYLNREIERLEKTSAGQ
jgi:hypothetical protein